MDKISNSVQYQNINMNKNVDINKDTPAVIVSKEKDDEKFKTVSNKYSLELCGAKKHTVNTQKAYDAIREASSEFGSVKTSEGYDADVVIYYNRVVSIMRDKGIPVVDFVPDGKDKGSFLAFADRVKDFAKDLMVESPDFLPKGFLDFCDLYKEKLKKYGCV